MKNTELDTLVLSSMVSSSSAFDVLEELISDMDLEIVGFQTA